MTALKSAYFHLRNQAEPCEQVFGLLQNLLSTRLLFIFEGKQPKRRWHAGAFLLRLPVFGDALPDNLHIAAAITNHIKTKTALPSRNTWGVSLKLRSCKHFMQHILNFRLHFGGSVPDSTKKDSRLLQWVLVEDQAP